jgi:hypothetical protein
MSEQTNTISEDSAGLPNGSGAAAILSAGIGSFAVALITQRSLVQIQPPQPLSRLANPR